MLDYELRVVRDLPFSLFTDREITVELLADEDITVEILDAIVHGSAEPYTGEYEVTPSQETQTLNCAGLQMSENVVVHPIPSNYGLITWNGAALTVS